MKIGIEKQFLVLLRGAVLHRFYCYLFLLISGHDALSFGLSEGFEYLTDVFAKAPTRASWDVHQTETTPKVKVTEGIFNPYLYGESLYLTYQT